MGRGFNAPFDPGYGFMSAQTRPQFQGGSDPSSGIGIGTNTIYKTTLALAPLASRVKAHLLRGWGHLREVESAPQPRAQSLPKVGG